MYTHTEKSRQLNSEGSFNFVFIYVDNSIHFYNFDNIQLFFTPNENL